MLNSKFLNDSAEILANRLQGGSQKISDQVSRAIELATSRPATDTDISDGVKLINTFQQSGMDANQALQRFCLLVLNLNEFVYLD